MGDADIALPWGRRVGLRRKFINWGTNIVAAFAHIERALGNLHFGMPGTPLTLKLALVWLYVMGWSSYGVETCAAFAPEYRDTARDTNLALKSAALFSLLVYALLPMGITGAIGEQAAVKDPVAFYVPAFSQIVGGASGLMVLLLAASLVLSTNTATADGARALCCMELPATT